MLLKSRVAPMLLALALGLPFLGCGDDDPPTRATNDSPTACFTVNPASGTTETVFTLDAGCSHDPQDSTAALQIRWDWENDGVWNTEWTVEKTATHQFATAGLAVVRMEVRDSGNLIDATLDTIAIGIPNEPPAACFASNSRQGTVEAVFSFDASCSSDQEDPLDSLRVRWDWEGDGVWDTDWTREKTAGHRYPTIGRKVIRMETLDTGGLSDEALDSVEVVIDYLGRPLPGLVPQIFPPTALRSPGVWTWHGSPAFSPDGREMFFNKYIHSTPQDRTELTVLRLENGQWGAPQLAPFADVSRFENNPWYSAGGDTLCYASSISGGFIVFVTRTSSGWSAPEVLPVAIPSGMSPGLQFSFSRNGTLYGELWDGSDVNIHKWEKSGAGYVEAENLGTSINTAYFDMMPFIDPEERFLLFGSKRPGGFGLTDIYISRSLPDGGWADPVNLGPQVNSAHEDGWPSITPDGRYLFFVSPRAPGSRGYEPLWVDIHFLDELGL